MAEIENWKTQVRKGYLELCLLLLIKKHKRLYGFDLLEKLEQLGMPVKEGTLYPLLNRMTADGTLTAVWQTDQVKGHPRKFYSLTREGLKHVELMRDEFGNMVKVFEHVNKKENER